MATYDPAAIRAQLKSLLSTASEVDSANVYDFFNPNINGYPAIVFDISDEQNEMLDEANNMRVLVFTIYVITEIKVAGLDSATTILDNAVKSITDLLEKRSNETLGGTVDWVTPVMGKRTQANSPEGALIYQEMKVKCSLASSIL